ncbi:MAG: hypothetical protein Ct9H300mP23_10780 [Nitrospinota bacterium]|nr:MAG: hypothetical protein Ct9H300mP23_10780 [Nitrospinota bacterium]
MIETFKDANNVGDVFFINFNSPLNGIFVFGIVLGVLTIFLKQ